MVSGGFAVVSIVSLLVVVALAVLTIALIVLVFAAIKVLRLSAIERDLRIERLRYEASERTFDGSGHGTETDDPAGGTD
ncbi:hypothetical protein [Curtobacterium citreum]|uniref:hypothetical protein n=1 Tax=Curtobacterium citreum TaxID=2036 RepID=UPI00254285A1|nr:hypothetical protein [Curtobacterium citreum]WIJ45274.1 hypothetical protein QPK07_16355 [Curtobacterium citreum]